MNRGDLSNEQWETLKPLLPPLKPRTGKPNRDHRQVMNGILWILRTGAPWRDLPERYGKWESVATRFYRWQKANIWQQVLERLQADADRQGKIRLGGIAVIYHYQGEKEKEAGNGGSGGRAV
jgi:Transposase and inactivated derivatives